VLFMCCINVEFNKAEKAPLTQLNEFLVTIFWKRAKNECFMQCRKNGNATLKSSDIFAFHDMLCDSKGRAHLLMTNDSVTMLSHPATDFISHPKIITRCYRCNIAHHSHLSILYCMRGGKCRMNGRGITGDNS